jgi:hypothetical protein
MSRIATNDKLKDAKRSKNDEFYTILSDVENELKHYKKHFKNKIVFCNCDDPRISNFFHYFSYNFEKLGLKKLITTCYKNHRPILGMDGYGGQSILIDMEKSRIVVINAVHSDYNWKKIVHSVIKNDG